MKYILNKFEGMFGIIFYITFYTAFKLGKLLLGKKSASFSSAVYDLNLCIFYDQ